MLPDEIKLPGAEDFCRQTFSNSKGQCCFLGWKQQLFPELTATQDYQFRDIAATVAKEMKLKQKEDGSYWYLGGLPFYNDHPRNTTKQLAEWFAKTVERFGYDVE